MRVPVHARRARFSGRVHDRCYERPALPPASGRFVDIEILQVALRIEEPRAALKEIVGETDEFAATLGDERMHRLKGIENACEGRIGDLAAPLSAIENEIAAPQRHP